MVSALSYVHKMKNMPNPADTFIIKKLLYALRRKQVQDKRCPITLTLLSQFMLQLPNIVKSSAIVLLIKCMFSLAFFALLRVGEVAITRTGSANTLQRQNVLFSYNKGTVQSATLTFTNFKHSNGQSATLVLRKNACKNICPVRLLAKYCSLNRNFTGPLFRFSCGQPVSATYFRSILKQILTKLNLDPKIYTTHSFRIGGATQAHAQNFTISQIKQLGRWKSSAFQKYIRPHSILGTK